MYVALIQQRQGVEKLTNYGQSLADRTLDQQCTVTRPGIAAIASALLVEILVSVLQHPLGGQAPAPTSPHEDRGEHPLGVVPHQIRGFLSTFQNLVIKGNSYDCCSACSPRIVGAYNADKWEFVKRALNEKGYVEELSGLAEVGIPVLGLLKAQILKHSRCKGRPKKQWPRLTLATTVM